ncbi:hypothetical protein HN51_062592, partial [Arachis hypogaea]
VLVSKITSNPIWPSLTLLISTTLTTPPNNAAVSLSQPVTTPSSNPSQHLHPSLPRRSCPTPPSPSLTRGANHQHHSSAKLISATHQRQPVSANRHSASADVSGVYRKRSVASPSSLASDASLASASLLERFDSLSLNLLETIVKNCKKAFSEVAAERVLDDMDFGEEHEAYNIVLQHVKAQCKEIVHSELDSDKGNFARITGGNSGRVGFVFGIEPSFSRWCDEDKEVHLNRELGNARNDLVEEDPGFEFSFHQELQRGPLERERLFHLKFQHSILYGASNMDEDSIHRRVNGSGKHVPFE